MVNVVNPLRDEHMHLPVVSKVCREVNKRRARLSEFFKDFDNLRRGECNVSALKCAMTQLNIELTETEFESILHAYYDSSNGKFRYRAFLHDVEESEEVIAIEEEKERESANPPASPSHIRSPKHVWPSGSLSVVRMLQAQVYEKRVDFRDFFHDFDQLRKGFVSESNLRCVLTQLHFDVTDDEIAELVRLYGVPGTGKTVDYRQLCTDVEKDLRCPRLEDDPSGMPPPQFDLFAAKEGKKAILSQTEKNDLTVIEDNIRRRTAQRGVYLLSCFRSFDKYNRLIITGNQFSRAMATLGFEIGQSDLDLLLKKYCIGGSASKFGYREFCSAIEP